MVGGTKLLAYEELHMGHASLTTQESELVTNYAPNGRKPTRSGQ